MAATPVNPVAAIEQTLRPELEKQIRWDMRSEPSIDAVHREITYSWTRQADAMKRLTEQELIICWEYKIAPADYLTNKRIGQ